MAQDRRPPVGYVESFRPNVFFGPDGQVVVQARADPLTDDGVPEIERKWRDQVDRSSTP